MTDQTKKPTSPVAGCLLLVLLAAVVIFLFVSCSARSSGVSSTDESEATSGYTPKPSDPHAAFASDMHDRTTYFSTGSLASLTKLSDSICSAIGQGTDARDLVTTIENDGASGKDAAAAVVYATLDVCPQYEDQVKSQAN